MPRIVSGGQTGVDRGALDAALAAGMACGGWAPEGRKAEDGAIPERYPVRELSGAGYKQRTSRNVQDSDATVILFAATLEGGTRQTRNYCVTEGKPFILLDARAVSVAEAVRAVVQFVAAHRVTVLNVAGPRASGWPGGQQYAAEVVGGVIAELSRAPR